MADCAAKINWRRCTRSVVFVAFLHAVAASAQPPDAAAASPSLLSYRVVATYPHDRTRFTQGLALHEGNLIESTGRYGQSRLCMARFPTMAAMQCRELERRYFGEGVAVTGQRIVQLTWRENTALVYDFKLDRQQTLRYAGEGWGLAYDGESLAMSDGSDTLRFLDPRTLAERRRVAVTLAGRPQRLLNELEFARGSVWANVWGSDRIAVIEPASGVVKSVLDLSALRAGLVEAGERLAPEHVLNGIAFDARSGRFLVTGKCWPRLFELEVE